MSMNTNISVGVEQDEMEMKAPPSPKWAVEDFANAVASLDDIRRGHAVPAFKVFDIFKVPTQQRLSLLRGLVMNKVLVVAVVHSHSNRPFPRCNDHRFLFQLRGGNWYGLPVEAL